MAKKQQQLPQRKIPMRQCLGCNEHKPKIELVRILRTPEGEITLDLTGKKSGRGAYLCHDVKCLRRVRKSGRLGGTLGVEIPAEVYDDMEKEMLLTAMESE